MHLLCRCHGRDSDWGTLVKGEVGDCVQVLLLDRASALTVHRTAFRICEVAQRVNCSLVLNGIAFQSHVTAAC